MKPKGKEENVEQWVSNRFGKRLYQHFFKTYTEKVWGVPTTELRAEWAAQRIKGLSFTSAAKAAFFGNKGNKIKSLIGEFHYPRFGPGQMWETMADEIIASGGEVRLNAPVEELEIRDGEVAAVVAGGERIEPSQVISSLPLRATVGLAGAAADGEVQAAAQGLRYRDFLTVALVIDGEDLFPDNWIYIHEPSRARRADPELPLLEPVDGPGRVEGLRRPRVLLLLGRRAVGDGRRGPRRAGQARARRARPRSHRRRSSAASSRACRSPTRCTTPDYGERVDVIRGWLEGIANLQQVGRNGLHRYNNSDHSMLTAIRAVDNIIDRRPARHLGGQRRVRLPRGRRQGRAALQARAGDPRDARAARLREPDSALIHRLPVRR